MVSIWFSINICMDMHLPHGIPSVFGATIESATLDLPIANMFDESWMCLVFYLYLFIFKLLIICIWHGILPVICVGYHNFCCAVRIAIIIYKYICSFIHLFFINLFSYTKMSFYACRLSFPKSWLLLKCSFYQLCATTNYSLIKFN
jgi:hypothetical protein